ncbi:DUF1294 domain-containing protein [Desulfovibrio mangrovi]|uniref:DUF1294 domain-containing protein n=1 Tax=Desulfovibrio mangrovi TaxID=2976983 RepID=UPI002246AB7A|nr:DUF1294 domain-containing protein [Desulfovibrio mangrovi]UZP66040.1 DUF1294 domain-containing protein [Desulfovibrio mangrovi]
MLAKDKLYLGVIAVFFGIIGAFAFAGKLMPEILAGYILTSLVSFFVYAVDKSTAQRGDWRVPESTLHLLSLVGGWPGALFAQQTLRHKTKKQPFRTTFWITVVMNCCAFIYLCIPKGRGILHTLIANVIIMAN